MRFGGQTQRQTAAHLNIGTGGAVSAQVRRLPAVLGEDRHLRRKVQGIDLHYSGLSSAGISITRQAGCPKADDRLFANVPFMHATRKEPSVEMFRP
jgi:hypothetical protein